MKVTEFFLRLFGWLGSVRAWMALAIVLTTCYLAIQKIIGAEAFVGIAVLVIKYYFDKERPAPKQV